MAFFNSNPNAGQINQLNKQMTQTLGEINGRYTELGRITKLKYLDKIDDPDIKRLAGEIDNMLASLQAMNKRINELKGLRECVGCHVPIGIGVAFCPNCGTKQPAAPQSMPMMGQPVPQPVPMGQPVPQNNFTQPVPPMNQPIPQPVPQPVPMGQMVGQPVPQPIPQPVPQPEPAPVIDDTPAPEPEPAPAPAPTPAGEPQYVFCTSCGNKEVAGTKFCSECGAVIE